jgi:hypothetical protein
MRRALTSTALAGVFAALAVLASAQERTHVRDVRVGAHPGFDRVVVELDGPAEIAWERGPEPNQESFYLDADLGKRARVIRTKLEQVGTVRLEAMRVGTQVSLEPRDRRMRVYLLAKPVRLVIDVAPPGDEAFAVPKGVTPLAPAASVGSLKTAPIPGPEPEPEAEPAPEPESPPVAAVTPPPTEPVEGAVEAAPTEAEPKEAEAPPESAAAPPAPESEAAPAPEPQPEPEAASEPAPAVEPAPAPAPTPEPLPPETGFPWGLALGTLAALAGLAALGIAIRSRSAPPPRVTRHTPPARPTPFGVDSITAEEIKAAAEASNALEQRLDEEVRARVALEDRLAQAGEELKVLRDRLHRVERRRDEAT